MNAIAVKKELYKSKAVAKFSHYVSGNIYYKVDLEDGTYQFPMSTVDEGVNSPESRKMYYLSEDLGTTPFYAEMKGSDLNRWIVKAIESGDFVKIG